MLRRWIFVATALLAGCQKKLPEAPVPYPSDTALRVRVAQAEVKRAAGLADLKELAASSDVHARELALRGLGRTGGADAITILEAALGDAEPRVVIAAATALGVLASLDEEAKIDGSKLASLLTHPDRGVRLAIAEALGRAGSAAIQTQLGCADRIAECALALGRHGRRKIKLGELPRKALVFASAQPDPALRYAATYALAREHEPATPDEPALVARITDAEPEIRAVAIAGLAKRKAAASARTEIEKALRDVDWRVAVEAARALANLDDAARTLVATSLVGRPTHVVHEALRAFAGTTLEPAAVAALTPLVKEPGWTGCLAAAALGGPNVVDEIATCQLPDHLKLPLLANVPQKNAALRVLLVHDDARVRAAGLGMLPDLIKEKQPTWDQALMTHLVSALASRDPIVAGSAADAIKAVYSLIPASARLGVDDAIVKRAVDEQDVELSLTLYGLISEGTIVTGLRACRSGLVGHPTRAKAAAGCMRALGEAPPTLDLSTLTPQAPPVDVATVIGKRITWELATSKGDIRIELRPDVAPWAVASIVSLTVAKKYDGIEFHRVVPNFVVQGGDPTSSGWGGPGYTLPAEPSGAADGAGFVIGGLGMADAGPDSAGSQWFIMHSRAAHLDGRYTWIGRVVSGMQVADALVIGDKVERAVVRVE